ncbi:hypothetical protein L1987_48619 [Smallanthus sonchifolius]|uniref:Uncharacterized protein n=1 Tax=Smallanthus sonchifolius TaxID=185202 RepID=A0ACB9FTC5_9ASTR|nr:hypothetical protein L1987_48619 [Smallanthus sonchifolius]
MRKLGFREETDRANLSSTHGACPAYLSSTQEEGTAYLSSTQEAGSAHLLSAQASGQPGLAYQSGNVIPSLVVDYGQRAIVAIRATGAVSWWHANGFDVVQLVGSNDGYSGVNVTLFKPSGQYKRELTECMVWMMDGDAWQARRVTRLIMKTGIPL